MVTPTTTNHSLIKCPYPKSNAFPTGANFILLKIYCVDSHLMKGCFGFSSGSFIPHPLDLHFPFLYPHMLFWNSQTVLFLRRVNDFLINHRRGFLFHLKIFSVEIIISQL